MAVSFGYGEGSSAWTTTPDPFTWSFTTYGTPKAVIVFVVVAVASTTNQIASVSYGEVALTKLQDAVDTAGEPGNVSLWWSNSGSLPADSQTISIDHSGNSNPKWSCAISVFGSRAVQVAASGKQEEDTANPSVAIDSDTHTAFRAWCIYSGVSNPVSLTEVSGAEQVANRDFGSYVAKCSRQTTPGTGSFGCGYSASSDDVALVAIGVEEVYQTLAATAIESGAGLGGPTVAASVTAQNISPSAITSGAALGGPTLTPGAVNRRVSAITSTASYGDPTVQAAAGAQEILPDAIASGAALGGPTLDSDYTLAATALESAAALGGPAVDPGPVDVGATAIASSAALGDPALSSSVTIAATAIDSASALGDPGLTASYTLPATAITSGEALGDPALSTSYTLAATALDSTAGLGDPAVASVLSIQPSAVTSSAALGAPSLDPGPVAVLPDALVSSAAYGTPTVQASAGPQEIAPDALTSSAALGAPTLQATYGLTATAIGSGAALGDPSLAAAYALGATALESAAALGDPALGATYTLVVDALASSTGLGAPDVAAVTVLAPDAVASTASLGAPTLSTAYALGVDALASAAALGAPLVASSGGIAPDALEPTSALGAPTLTPGPVAVVPEAISSAAALGAPTVSASLAIKPSAIGSTAALGAPTLEPGPVAILPSALASSAALGAPTVLSGQEIQPAALESAAALGAPGVKGAYAILPAAIPGAAGLGLPVVEIAGRVLPDALPSAADLGVPTFSTTVDIQPSALESTADVRTPANVGELVVGFHNVRSATIRSAFYTLIETTTALDGLVHYDNATTEHIAPGGVWPDSLHAAVNVVWIDGEVIQTGQEVHYRADGELSVQLRAPPGTGDKDLLELGDLILTTFRGTLSNKVTFRGGRILRRGMMKGDPRWPVGGWYVVEVSIPFFGDDTFARPAPTYPATVSNFETAANVVRLRFHSNVASPIGLNTLYDNAMHTQNTTKWARFSVLPGFTDQVENVGTHVLPGLAIAQMYVPVGTGDAAALELADTVYEQFRAAVDAGVAFQVPTVRSVGRSGEWWQVNVACPFTAYQHS